MFARRSLDPVNTLLLM